MQAIASVLEITLTVRLISEDAAWQQTQQPL